MFIFSWIRWWTRQQVFCCKHIRYIMSSEYRKKGFYKTWTFYCSSPQYRGKMVYQTMHFSNKKRKQGIETEISWVDNENFKCAWIYNIPWYFTYHWSIIWSKTDSAETITRMFHAKVAQWAQRFTICYRFTWRQTRRYKLCDN